MEHPFFRTLQTRIIYFTAWMVLLIVHAVIVTFVNEFSFSIALIDSTIFNLTFCFLGLSIWFVVKFSRASRATVFNQIVNYLTAFLVLIFIWYGISFLFAKGLLGNNEVYIAFLTKNMALRIISGGFYYIILTLIYLTIIYYKNLQNNLLEESKLKEKIKEAELNLLKSQINPHFLFNSLNSISSLTITNPEKAQDMVIKLSDFLRYTIANPDSAFSSFTDEIENIKKYLDIEQVRFGKKLLYEFIFDENCLRTKIPVMILQPIYENAVKHGVYESTEPICILTKCQLKDKELFISISNNFDSTAKPRKGEGIGLKNIQQRLKLIYKSDNLIKTSKTENNFSVELLIPQLN